MDATKCNLHHRAYYKAVEQVQGDGQQLQQLSPKQCKIKVSGTRPGHCIRQRAIAIVGFAFVDDTDLIHTTRNRATPTAQLMVEAQEALTLWENLLHATWGALAPERATGI
jgi:dissimilatory sulfite reductase (desulfoviridin) alpha/beta subunit